MRAAAIHSLLRAVIAVVVAGAGAWLAAAPPTSALSANETPAAIHVYDGRHHNATPTDATTERGPPAPADRVALAKAIDMLQGISARTHGQTPPAIYDYGNPAPFVRVVGAATTTEGQARRSDREASSVARASVAANAGTRALPVGPWGQKIVDARTKLPSSWGPGSPNAKGVGTRWFDPANKGNGVRLDQGIPGSSFGSQQVDHVVVRSGGRILGPDGKPIVGSLSQNPQAHIPLSEWRTWSSWSTP